MRITTACNWSPKRLNDESMSHDIENVLHSYPSMEAKSLGMRAVHE
jgi:hypothetical protein